MTHPLDIIIVERLGSLKLLSIKDFKHEDLFKKCGFKKAEDFAKQTEWTINLEGKTYYVEVFGKKVGRANSENKYDFPPPIDNIIFYGNCAILSKVLKPDGTKGYSNLSISIWNKLYEKLFGGFHDISDTLVDDENEVDDLENVNQNLKTKKGGYLKDGFVVDSSDTDENENLPSSSEELDSEDEKPYYDTDDESDDEVDVIDDELVEEKYDY